MKFLYLFVLEADKRKNSMHPEKCPHMNTSTQYDAGWDIWPGGEERQHIETCSDCGAYRFVCNVADYEKGSFVTKGKWIKEE